MYLLYCDESNLDPKQGDFFVYGGVAIPVEKAKDLHLEIEAIRKAAGFKPDDDFKYNPGPDGVDYQEFLSAKESLLCAASSVGCRVFLSIILHKIGHDTDLARRSEINRVVYHFDCFLNRFNSSGLVLIDRFSDKQIDAHLREKFSTGLKDMPYSKEMRLKNILGIHYSAIGQSHFASIVDIVVGTFRYSVNVHSKEKDSKYDVAKMLLGLLEPMMIRDSSGLYISQLSLNFDPYVIKYEGYRKQYESLITFFETCGINPKQEISDHRLY